MKKVQTVDSEIHQTEQVPEEEQTASHEPAPRNLFRRFISRIPYTNEFGTRIKEYQESLHQARLDAYERIRSIDRDLKDELYVEFYDSALQLSQAQSWIWAADFYSKFLTLVMLCPLYFAGPPLVARYFHHLAGWGLYGFWWWVLELLLSVLTGILAAAILFLPLIAFRPSEKRVRDQVRDFFNVRGLVFCWSAMLLILASGYLYAVYGNRLVAWPWPFSHRLSFFLLIQAGFFLPLFYAAGVLPFFFWSTLQRRKRRFHARAAIIDLLLETLHDLEQPKDEIPWTKFWYRASLTRRLEMVASCIENHFPGHFLTGVQETDRWVDRTTSEMASGVREMIRWIVTPNADTHEDLKARVIRYLTAALASEWGEFDRVPAEKLSRKQGVRAQVISTVTALLTAAVPILLLLLIKKLGVIAEPLTTYLTVGAFVWAALSLLSRLDPQYAAKLGALKDITTVLPFGKKGGDGN